jgi:hypothetical protein
MRAEDLDGTGLEEGAMDGSINDAHSATAEALNQPVRAEVASQ